MKVSGKSSLFLAFLVSVCLLLDFTTVIAAIETTAGTLTAKPGNESLAILAPYTGDSNGNNRLLIEWDESGGDWETHLESTSLTNAPTPYAFTITGLNNGAPYQVRVTWLDDDNSADPTQTLTGLIPFNKLIHCSLSTGSAKWGYSGWGVAGGKYGEFTCQTCHQRNSGNIKRVKKDLVVTDQDARDDEDRFPIEQATGTVNFQETTGANSFGDDNRTDRSVSDMICEACHSLTTVHRYNSAIGVTDFNHMDANQQDCINCHTHNNGFAHSDGIYGNSCLECHTGDHDTNKNQANWVTLFDSHEYVGRIDTFAECSLCHQTNVLAPHASNCALCHDGTSPPRDSFGTWNQTCQLGNCHPSKHAAASAAHDAEYDADNCYGCHNDPSFEISWPWGNSLPGFLATAAGCGECHKSLPSDTTPPVSSSDLHSEYIDTALISLSAFDSWAVQSIFYSLDGEEPKTYSGPFEVPAPVEGSQAHTLEYWAIDTSGNVEVSHIDNFTVTKDTTPPVTTSNAKLYYGAEATINLVATDNATSFPVAATYFVFDDLDGTPTEDDTAVFPEPATDSEVHTLYFWSVDHAGNIENPPKSATFTMIADGLENTVLYLDQTVGFYTDPEASAPSIRYSIYINDQLKKVLTMTAEGPDSTEWNCPQTNIAPGGDIDVVVEAWFGPYTGEPGTFTTRTYSFTLPVGTILVEASTWNIYWNMQWEPVENDGDGGGDYAYVEAQPERIENVIYVTASPDVTPPVTTSNIESGKTYFDVQTFALTASDPGGTGVESTHWQLDSTTGSWTSGTSVAVPAPASGTANHTLYWYSKDRAGNVEATKSVSFSILAVVEEVTALHLSEWVGMDTDPLTASGPIARYTIKLDGDVIGSFTAANASPATDSSDTFTWTCPEGTYIGEGAEGRIDIIVEAYFSSHGTVWWQNTPKTYTFYLPEGAKQLEAVEWKGFPSRVWAYNEYDDEGDQYDYIGLPPGTISNIKYLTTMPDTTPPVTTSNVVSGKSYTGNQTFALSPSDPGGTGVKLTKWQLDSTTGIWKTGTSVTVAAPASGTKAHTLYWYSQDYANNQETIKSVSFSTEKIIMPSVSLPLDQVVWYDSEAGASLPQVHYKIFLDNDLTPLGEFDAGVPAAGYSSNAVKSWFCPKKVITGAGVIKVEVSASFSNPGAIYAMDSPKTFTITLPAGAQRLEAATWTGFPYLFWNPNALDEEGYEYSTVYMPAGKTITKISYAPVDADITAPATAIDAEEGYTYYGDKTFILAPDDFGGSGVESTWWQLDGSGVWSIGTTVTVAAPTAGSVSHTIIWFSRDNVSNQETHQSVTFDMSP